jgi:molecular chaperone GrpE
MGEMDSEPREIPIQFARSENSDESENAGSDPAENRVVKATDASDSDPEASQQSESEDPVGESDETGAIEISSPLAEMQAQIDALTAERTGLYDQLLRRQAEFENYRKRVERERGETYQRARAEVLLEFLPVVDNLERALSSLENSQGDADALRNGVELIHKQFHDALGKFGLEPVPSVGQTFDPHVHEAVTTEPSDQHEENTVIEEFQRGYKMGDKLLRPAKVKVASTPER